ncbi:MAG TPA: hypothetical protein VHW03_02625, partial [Chthoniobacterales bacterium]|nr:hypothetical protein [Chthoniobacterales bacterium]
WAFDRGLFGIDDNRCVFVPPRVRAMAENVWLLQFHTRAISEAVTPSLRAVQEAFAWHLANVNAQWR